jgi:type VI secretion system protein
MREERLLERIQSWEREPARREKENPRRVVNSVLRHLQRILNTKQGNVPIAEDYGVPDFTDFLKDIPDSIRELEKAIRLTVQKYEPRLQEVGVSFIPQEEDLFAVHFQLMARLTVDPKTQVFIETLIDSEGKVEVKG